MWGIPAIEKNFLLPPLSLLNLQTILIVAWFVLRRVLRPVWKPISGVLGLDLEESKGRSRSLALAENSILGVVEVNEALFQVGPPHGKRRSSPFFMIFNIRFLDNPNFSAITSGSSSLTRNSVIILSRAHRWILFHRGKYIFRPAKVLALSLATLISALAIMERSSCLYKSSGSMSSVLIFIEYLDMNYWNILWFRVFLIRRRDEKFKACSMPGPLSCETVKSLKLR